MSGQWHFDFKDWEQAFEMFYRKRCGEDLIDEETGQMLGRREGNPNITLAVSTGSYASGYWIEENAKPDAETTVYTTVEEVKAFEKRLRGKRANTVSLSLGGVVS